MKAKKKICIDRLEKVFLSSKFVLLLKDHCMDAVSAGNMRRELRANDDVMIYAKNNFAKIASRETDFAFLEDKFCESVILVFSQNAVSVAKLVKNLAVSNEKFSVMGAGFESRYLTQTEVMQLASLPSLDELRAKIIALLKTPVIKLNSAIQGPARKLTFLVSAHSNKSNS